MWETFPILSPTLFPFPTIHRNDHCFTEREGEEEEEKGRGSKGETKKEKKRKPKNPPFEVFPILSHHPLVHFSFLTSASS